MVALVALSLRLSQISHSHIRAQFSRPLKHSRGSQDNQTEEQLYEHENWVNICRDAAAAHQL